jgi:hypothetical protein
MPYDAIHKVNWKELNVNFPADTGYEPVPVAAQSKACMVLDRLNFVTMGSSNARHGYMSPLFLCSAVLCR